MSPSRNLWVNWILPAAVIAVLVVSALAWRSKPPSTLICRTWGSSAATLTAAVPSETPAWHLHATFDRGLKPPGPEWRLFEGAEPDTGYELRWLPQRLAIQLFRTGEHPQLLASAELERVPREIDFTRHGLRLTVAVDGIETIRVADLLPAPVPTAWGFQAATGMGEVMLSVYDAAALLDDSERRLLEVDAAALVADAADPAIDVSAIARARQAVGLDAKLEPEVEHAQAQAELALTALMHYEDDRLSCTAWLAWNRVRLALARDDAEGTDRATAGVAALVRLSREPPFGQELPGLLMQLLPLLADRAAQRPERPMPPEQVLAQRERWLGLIAEIGYAVMDIKERDLVTTENLHWQLRLLRHGAECLAGKSAEPTPAEGPVWVVSRWRAFAGRNPTKAGALPDLPAGWHEHNPVQPALVRLTGLGGFDPLAALWLSERVLTAVERKQPAQALAALDDPAMPEREVIITRAILAARGIGDLAAARKALAVAERGQPAWAERDALAFAVLRLLDHRHGGGGDLPGVVRVPEALAAFARVLNGTANASSEIWDVPRLPPGQALAAAFAMQEAAGGGAVPWELVDRLACFTLPVALLAPPEKPAPVEPVRTRPAIPALVP